MSDEMTCEQVGELAPELALDIAGGQERDAAVRHLATCATCRQLVAELSSVSDELLLLAPSHEAPAGFEDRILAKLAEPPALLVGERPAGRAEQRARRTWWKTALVAAAAAVLAAAVAAGSVLQATSTDRRVAASYRDLLNGAGGSFFAAAPLQGTDGRAGSVFGYQGSPSWVFVTLYGGTAERRYQVRLITTDGQRLELGDAILGGAHDTWGRAIPVGLTKVRWLQFLDAGGAPVFAAPFHVQDPWASG